MMTELSLSVDQKYNGRDAPPDGTATLLDLAEQLARKELISPPHQRSRDAWSLDKQRAWIQRNRDAVSGKKQRPLGIVCIYLLADEGYKCKYLNEGLQRVSTANEAMLHPKKYGFNDKEEAQNVLRGSYVHVQYRHYNSHSDAARDFQEVNNGTGLDKSEKFKHVIVYSPDWMAVWESQFEKWSLALREMLASFTKTDKRRSTTLLRDRSNRHLFAVAHICKPTKGSDSTDEVERCVVEAFRLCTPDDVSVRIKKLENFAAEIESAWRVKYSQPGVMMNNRLARWCCGVMFLNPDMRTHFWQDFFGKLFTTTRGQVNLIENRDDAPSRTHFLTSDFGRFRTVCRVIDIEIPEKQRRKSSNVSTLKQGYQNDHKQSFADFGDGPTEPMAARLNAAKNARAPLA